MQHKHTQLYTSLYFIHTHIYIFRHSFRSPYIHYYRRCTVQDSIIQWIWFLGVSLPWQIVVGMEKGQLYGSDLNCRHPLSLARILYFVPLCVYRVSKSRNLEPINHARVNFCRTTPVYLHPGSVTQRLTDRRRNASSVGTDSVPLQDSHEWGDTKTHHVRM